MARSWVALVVMLAAAESATAWAAAGNVGRDPISGEIIGACPDVAAVRRLLAELVSPEEARGVAVSLEDQGSRYRIEVRGEVTTLDDPARDCADRVREASVVIASALRSHAEVFGPPLWTVEKGFVFDFAAGQTKALWAPGAEIRGAYGRGLWSVFGAAGARGPVTLAFDGGWQAELLRFPFDLGARLTSRRWRLRPWVGLGPSLTLTGLLGENLIETERQWRVDPGALLLAGATLPVRGRVGVAAAINIRWQPRPYHLQVSPVGIVGDTPTWWFGISLNYTLDARLSSP